MQGRRFLYQYIVKRLYDSFNLPTRISRFLELMAPPFRMSVAASACQAAPASCSTTSGGASRHARRGQLAVLGLVKVKSDKPEGLGNNRQVLAYGYDLDGTDLTLHLYDPSYADNDNVTMHLNVADAHAPVSLSYDTSDTVYCFFHTRYTFAHPPTA